MCVDVWICVCVCESGCESGCGWVWVSGCGGGWCGGGWLCV